MAATSTIEINPESEFARAVRSATASGERLIVAIGRDSYELGIGTRTAELLDNKPAAEHVAEVRAAIDAAAGAWKDFDAEAFKRYLRERRRTANRPATRC